jgi:hypothetical protein
MGLHQSLGLVVASVRWQHPDMGGVRNIAKAGVHIAASTALFFSASLVAGRVWRFPFDDEIFTLTQIERYSFSELLSYDIGGDVHPPISYLMFKALQNIGLTEPAMRLVSPTMTASAIALFHFLTITILRKGQPTIGLPSRLMAVVLFGLCPLAVSLGDSLRWYPIFALLSATFIILYLNGDASGRLLSAIPLGLAVSTNFLGVLLVLSFAIYRYVLQRTKAARFDAVYWSIFVAFGSLGLYWLSRVLTEDTEIAKTQFGNHIAYAAASDLLGFFGGHALGISQAWMAAPGALVSLVAAISLIDRTMPQAKVHLLLLLLVMPLTIVLLGFSKPRSFLYLAPVLSSVLTLFIAYQAAYRRAAALILFVLLISSSIAAIANINFGTHPFKRNSAIPYQTLLDFVDGKERGDTLVFTTDPALAWILDHQRGSEHRCVIGFLNKCFDPGRHYGSIFVVSGHTEQDSSAEATEILDRSLVGRQLIATSHAGLDKDAEIKSKLLGTALDENILTIQLYR